MTVFWTGGTPDLAGYGPRTMACESQNMTNSKCGKLRHMIWVSHGQEHFALPEYTEQRNRFVGETEATYQMSCKCLQKKILTHFSLVALRVVGGKSLQRQSRLSASC